MSAKKPDKGPARGLVLVDGAGGFLGSHVVERLCRSGFRVRATDLPASNLRWAEAAGADVVALDLANPEGVLDVVRGVRFVVHVAGLFDYSLPAAVLRLANVETTRNLCEACKRAGVERFIHVSSIAVYGRPRTRPVREDHPLQPNNLYALTKIRGEEVALGYHQAHGLPVLAVRPAGIYGPRSRYGQVHLFALMSLLQARGRKTLPAFRGGPAMHHVHVEDVARAIELLLRAPVSFGEAYNVGDDTPLTQGDFVRFAMRQAGLSIPVVLPYSTRLFWSGIRLLLALPESAWRRFNTALARAWETVVESRGLEPAVRPRLDRDFLGYMNADYVLDTGKINALGFTLKHPSTLEGMARTLAWYRQERWLPCPEVDGSVPARAGTGLG